MRAMEWARESGRFNGEPIKVRVKSESILKGSFTPSFFASNATLPLYAPMQAPIGANARGFARRPDVSGGRGRRGVTGGGRPVQPGVPYPSAPSQAFGPFAYGGGAVGAGGGGARVGSAGGGDGTAKQSKRKDGSLRVSKPRGEGIAPVPLSPVHFPPLPNKVAGSDTSGAPSPSKCGARLHFSFVMSSFRYGVSEMQEMFRRLSSALPAGVDTDCPVVLSLPETVLEQDRPDGMYAALSWKSVVPALESRQDLTSKASKKRAMSSQKLPRPLRKSSSRQLLPTAAPQCLQRLRHVHTPLWCPDPTTSISFLYVVEFTNSPHVAAQVQQSVSALQPGTLPKGYSCPLVASVRYDFIVPRRFSCPLLRLRKFHRVQSILQNSPSTDL